MATMRAFHEKVKQVKPQDTGKPSTFWVGVLYADKTPEDIRHETDLLWIKCPGKISAKTIREEYLKRRPENEEIMLHIAYGHAVGNNTKISDLDIYGDKIIAFHAYKPGAPIGAATPRQPLQPIAGQLPAKPASDQSFPMKVKDENTARAIERLQSASLTPNSPSYHTPPTLASTQRGTPSPVPSAQDLELADLAAHEFKIEKREFAKRVFGRNTTADQVEADLQHQWTALVTSERQKYRFRASLVRDQISDEALMYSSVPPPRMADVTRVEKYIWTSGGFWLWFYDKNFISDGPQHDHLQNQQNQDSVKFLDDIKSWGYLKPLARRHFIAAYRAQNRDYLQATGPSPVPPVKQETQAKYEPSSFDGLREADFEEIADEKPAAANEGPPLFQMQKLFADCTPEQLEKGVEEGVKILTKLKSSLTPQAEESEDAKQWLQSIANVEKQAVRTKTIVGVVGNTGAGKSSVINAMLDLERLVPTNCMRACTAVVTEISYNHEAEGFRAEIEFIEPKDWAKELKTLFQDLFDGNGNVSRECTNEDSEAGIAYAKIKAVYPKMTKEDIQNSSVEKLMSHENVTKLLGTSKTVIEDDSMRFYKKLQFYVDSKEKSTGDKEKDKDKKAKRQMEFWPLIRVVRLYVRADALSTGAVIVDLPGVHDSNQARAAVAEGYMKQCTGLWIVAPINRAVDDKAAKSLLGESFKRQLKMDGGFSTVTFICSKTDDISLIEAQDSLGLEEEMGALWAKSDEHTARIRSLQKELERLKETKSDFSAAMEAADEQIEVWDKLKEDLDDGKAVYAPNENPNSKKRKRGAGDSSKRKKQRKNDSDDDSDYAETASEDEDSADDAESEPEQHGEPLTDEQITTKLAELKATKKEGRQERARLDEQIQAIRKEKDKIKEAEDKVQAEMSAICISGRNGYSKGAIQQDFAAGIKELDQELAEEEDAANFNPDVDARDYDEVAKSLPVFCVSSRGYQKLQGRLLKDPPVPGFKAVEETEIPQLQAHCKKLTEAGREATSRRFLNSLSQLLNSLRLWSSNDGSGGNLTHEQKVREEQVLQDKLRKLDTDLDKSIKHLCTQLGEEIQDNIYDKFEAAIASAKAEAEPTAFSWGAPVNRSDRAAGGLYWATYKALCRRYGVFSNAQGPHDWNTQLTDPMLKQLAPGWEKTFSRRVPSVLNGLATSAGSLLETFHREVEARATRNGVSFASFQMLKHQLPTYKEIFKDLSASTRNEVMNQQKEINRAFVPVITDAMARVYDDCADEVGPGQYQRMKGLMSRWVDEKRHQMFASSTSAVQKQLKKLINTVEEQMLTKADDVFMAVKRDYSSVVVGKQGQEMQSLPRAQRFMRRDVQQIVEGSEIVFKRAVGLAPPADDEDEQQVKGEEHQGMDSDEREDDVSVGSFQDALETSATSLGTLPDAAEKAASPDDVSKAAEDGASPKSAQDGEASTENSPDATVQDGQVAAQVGRGSMDMDNTHLVDGAGHDSTRSLNAQENDHNEPHMHDSTDVDITATVDEKSPKALETESPAVLGKAASTSPGPQLEEETYDDSPSPHSSDADMEWGAVDEADLSPDPSVNYESDI